MVRKGYDVAGGDDVVHADECGAISIGYDRQGVGSDVGYFFDGLCFHIAIADGCSGRGWANVGFPLRGGHEEMAGGGGHHGTTVKDCVGVVGGGMDVLHKCLCACLFAKVVDVIRIV